MSHVTRTPLSGSKGQRSKSPAALLTAVLARQAAAAVGLRACRPCETDATLPSARRRKAPTGRGKGRGHIVAAARLQLVIVILFARLEK